MAAIHRKSCIKFIPKSLVVSVVLVVSVGKAIVLKHPFWNAIPNSFFCWFYIQKCEWQKFSWRNNRRKCGWNRREATGMVGDIGIMVKLNAFFRNPLYFEISVKFGRTGGERWGGGERSS